MKRYRNDWTKVLILLILSHLTPVSYSQPIASLELDLPKAGFEIRLPVSINLDEVTWLPDSLLILHEIHDKTVIDIPFQVEPGNPRKLTWLVTVGNNEAENHLYEILKGKSPHQKKIKSSFGDGYVVIESGNKKLLQYNFKTVYPPSGVDTAYRRSGFIHPLWSPDGQILTRIQPPDHYHHYGIWNPWTHVEYEGDTIDFWNLNSRQGTVRFAKFVSVEDGPVFSGFSALHEHVIFRKGGNEKVALNELFNVRIYAPEMSQDFYIVDFSFQLNCADESPVRLLEYRYAGLGWRTTEKWDNKNSMVLTSEGKTRKDADGSRARWCLVQGEIDNDYAGVEMMSYPTNYNFPEPLRIWPEDQYNRGDMFANFCPVKDMDWYLAPHKNYLLKYRFLVFNGRFDKEKAEAAWYYFANPPVVKVSFNK